MQSNLARALVARGIIRAGSMIEAYKKVRSLSCSRDARVVGSFLVKKAVAIDGLVFFDTAADGEHHRIPCTEVVSVDGMPIFRLAISHHLNLEGESLKRARRRGRRPGTKMAKPEVDRYLIAEVLETLHWDNFLFAGF